MRAKRFLLLSIIFFMLLLLTPNSVLAASKKTQAAVKNEVKAFMKDVKAYKPAKIDEHFVNSIDGKLIYNADVQQLIRKYHKKHIKYSIKSISISGKKATAKIHLRYYNASFATKYGLKKYVDYAFNTGDVNTDLILKYMKKYYKSDYGTYDECTLSIPLVKVDGKWKIQKLTKKMYGIIDGGIAKTLNYYIDHPYEMLFIDDEDY